MRFLTYLHKELITELSLDTKEDIYTNTLMQLGAGASNKVIKFMAKLNIGKIDPVKFLGFDIDLKTKKIYTYENKKSNLCYISIGDNVYCIEAPKKAFAKWWIGSGSNSSDKIFPTKTLTPDKLGLAGQTLTANQIIETVKIGLESKYYDKYDTKVKEQLLYLLESAKNTSNKISIKELTFGKADLKTISKDFGEVIAAVWSLQNYSKAFFPDAINEKLVDFYGVKNGERHPISVKSGGGSAASIANLIPALSEINTDELNNKERKLVQAILIAEELYAADGFIEAGKIMNIPEIKLMKEYFGNNYSYKSILENIGDMTSEEMRIKYGKLFKMMSNNGNSASPDSWKSLDISPDRRIGLILGPLSWRVVNELNTEENQNLLTKILSTVQIQQLNVDVTKNKIIFKLKAFKEAKFKFSWQGGAPNYKRNKLGFKMV